ncbi:hypothetical protein MRS44_006614 [Fusarium solani]|uniref:uncharacterized protein n=1 Tax=Fusarium solani TaxID=169388 RepID=UPI0032C499D8|nr:hypothetical protein MRS44_006614 [Fusarium solani]
MDDGAHPGSTVIDYALKNQCFRRHRDAPYRFHDQLPQLRTTLHPVESDGLVHQPGIIDIPLPRPNIQPQPPPEGEAYSLPVDPFVPSTALFPFLGQTKQLRLPSEALDTGHNAEKDLQQYLTDIYNKSFCDILSEWLPLSPVNIDNDEALDFPSTTIRWKLLADRELELEAISGSEETQRILHEEEVSSHAECYGDLFALRKATYPEPLSVPLSPASDLDEPFEPNSDVLVIDLTSEPRSPVDPAVEKLQQDLHDGCLDSEPAAPSTMPSSPPAPRAVFLGDTEDKASNYKLDVPLMPSSPRGSQELQHHGEIFALQGIDIGHTVQPREEPQGFFDEEMSAILAGYHAQTTQMLENERPNPAESLLRMPVPALDFHIPDPDWSVQLSTPEDHFQWLRENLMSAFQLDSSIQPAGLSASLKWTPVPHGSGQISLNEEMEQLGPASRQFLMLEVPRLSSRDYIDKASGLKILQVLEDEEMEAEAPPPEAPSPEAPTVAVSQATAAHCPRPNLPGMPRCAPSLDDLLKSRYQQGRQTLRRKAGEESTGLLLGSSDPSATSNLLSSFMELRHAKKPKTTHSTIQQPSRQPIHISTQRPHPAPSPSQLSANETTVEEQAPESGNHGMRDAPTPEFHVPTDACRFIVSSSLNRNVLSQLDKSWPQLELVDRDFSQYNTVIWSSGSAQRKEVISRVSFEADVSLCPSAGIIVTTMLKVRQKPLPGSTALSPLRERVQAVSTKYEYLFILVSESNPVGEYVGSPSTSDMMVYADFVRFTAGLQRGITTYLVSGAECTLSKWILSLMCRYSPQAKQLGKALDFHDTTWELFLRRAGLNINAAQVISEALVSEYGNLGLASFLTMTTEELVSKFGPIMGGERVLRNVSRGLHQQWL